MLHQGLTVGDASPEKVEEGVGMEKVTDVLKAHYKGTFDRFGPTSKGVDWGDDVRRATLRHQKMLSILADAKGRVSLLDVGCGYGGLLEYARAQKLDLDYTGIDVAENMISWAQANQDGGTFVLGDILETDLSRTFDFVVCNGILTQKLSVSNRDMDGFAQRLIRRVFDLCTRGVAFNVMTNRVNFYADNLYYRSPVELLGWCMDELTVRVRLDHSYPLYEFTTYLFKDPSQ